MEGQRNLTHISDGKGVPPKDAEGLKIPFQGQYGYPARPTRSLCGAVGFNQVSSVRGLLDLLPENLCPFCRDNLKTILFRSEQSTRAAAAHDWPGH